ncbi:MAG: DUF6057 family protein [Bacteroidota bacterium]|nr:DUF6057 family protein [Bacteroidota bacterium]
MKNTQHPAKGVVKKTPGKGLNLVNSLNGTALGLFIIAVLYYTVGINSGFLFKLQELDLFSTTPEFFSDTISKIGGLSVYAGTFLTQFFYYPWLGSIIYLLLLLLVVYLVAKAFNLTGKKLPLAFIPSLALVLCTTELGYLIYIQKLHGIAFVCILGVLIILAGWFLIRRMKGFVQQTCCLLLYLLAAYPVCGAYALLGGLLMLLHVLKQAIAEKELKHWMPVIVAAAGLYLIPFLYYQAVYHQIYFNNLFCANLPNFKVAGHERLLWLPYVLIAVFFILAALTGKKEHNVMVRTSFFSQVWPAVVFLAGLFVLGHFTYHDKNFNTELSMLSASEQGNWNNVLKLARADQDEPTRLIVMSTKLALVKLGIAADNEFKYKNGNKPYHSPREILPIEIAGPFFYYQYGKENYCYKWCMEQMVEYGMNAYVMKYFVLSCLLNGETKLAQKYNDVLASTLFYKSWAKAHQRYIDHPEAIAKAPEFAGILPLTNYTNILEGDQGILENFIRDSFANLTSGPPSVLELSMLSNLELKNAAGFMPKFAYYTSTNKRIPVHFQEAAILFLYLEHKVDINQLPVDKNMLAKFQLLLSYLQQYHNYSEDAAKVVYANEFGDTYWYYYLFANTKKPKDTAETKAN